MPGRSRKQAKDGSRRGRSTGSGPEELPQSSPSKIARTTGPASGEAFLAPSDPPSTSAGAAPSTSKGDVPSTSKGDAPSTSKGDAPSASKGDAPSASKGGAASKSKKDESGGITIGGVRYEAINRRGWRAPEDSTDSSSPSERDKSEPMEASSSESDATSSKKSSASDVPLESCDVCGIILNYLDDREAHLLSHCSTECEECKVTLETIDDVSNHMKTHERNYQCYICAQMFFSIDIVASHVETHVLKTRECKMCRYGFLTNAGLQKHLASHMYLEYCSTCHESFDSYTGLENHFQQHRALKCPFCDEHFEKMDLFIPHTEVHVEELKKMDKRDESYALPRITITREMQREARDIIMSQPVDPVEVAQARATAAHAAAAVADTLARQAQKEAEEAQAAVDAAVAKAAAAAGIDITKEKAKVAADPATKQKKVAADTATKQKKVAADSAKQQAEAATAQAAETAAKEAAAAKAVKDRDAEAQAVLNEAMRTLGITSPIDHFPLRAAPHTCDLCGDMFRKDTEMDYHMASKHVPARCEVCGNGLRLAEMAAHLNSHAKPFMCHICGYKFMNTSILSEHVNKHKLRKRVCKVCRQDFRTNAGFEGHLGAHRFLQFCLICRQTFITRSELEIHFAEHRVLICMVCGDESPDLLSFEAHVRAHD